MLNFENKRVLCIGDVMLDRFFYGTTDRISPEAPVPVVRLSREERMLGGVGNVARNIAALGGEAIVLGIAGKDDAGVELTQALAALSGVIDASLYTQRRVTTRKTRVVAGQQHIVRLDEEDSAAVDGDEAEEIIRRIVHWTKDCQAVILSDYAKGVLTRDIVRAAISAAHTNGIPVFVDPKRKDFAFYAGATVLTPNLKELGAAANARLDTEIDIADAATRLLKDGQAEAILVTRSERGMMLVTAEGRCETVGTKAREVYDVSGAGDTVIAVFTLAVITGHDMFAAMHIANTAAGIVVSKLGTATVEQHELSQALLADSHSARPHIVSSLSDALLELAQIRTGGARIGVMQSWVDQFGRDQLIALSRLRAECDYTVIALSQHEGTSPNENVDTIELISNLRDVDLTVRLPESDIDALLAGSPPSMVIDSR